MNSLLQFKTNLNGISRLPISRYDLTKDTKRRKRYYNDSYPGLSLFGDEKEKEQNFLYKTTWVSIRWYGEWVIVFFSLSLERETSY